MKNRFFSSKKLIDLKSMGMNFIGENRLNSDIGDIIKVGIKIDEGKNQRIQYYEGLVIKDKGSGISSTITVRRMVQGIGTERVLPICSPNIASFEQKRSSFVRRAKLYFIRELSGKATRLKERFS